MLIAVASGLITGALRARLNQRTYQPVAIRYVGLVFAAYLPQFFAFYLPATRRIFPDAWVPPILVGSQILLLLFAWINRKLPGFSLLGLGLLANFLVIVLNGGMMPLMPENASKLIPQGSQVELEIGGRVGYGKDVLLEKENTRLWFLGDVFTLPEWMNYPLAFSIGDILISMGAFWLFWQLGGPQKSYQEASR